MLAVKGSYWNAFPTTSSRPDSFPIARHQHLSTRPAYTRKSRSLLGSCDVRAEAMERDKENH
jgi:hypothetical protein